MSNAFLDAIRVVRDAAAGHDFRVALIGGFALPLAVVTYPSSTSKG